MPVTRQPLGAGEVELEVFPLAKKPGASFPDRITIGRTANNDIVIADHSISRLHAYVKRGSGGGGAWLVADAGSKNGSALRGLKLEARKEQTLASRMVLRLGEVDLTFYEARDLYGALGGV
jgi:pSer/pThr/pTyr-binding forkhead associated (FHA) protein